MISFLAFLLVQIWGISFEALKVVFLQTPSELIGISLPAWQLEAIALAYQLGVLILPTMLPIVIWAFFYRDFIAYLINSGGIGKEAEHV